MNNIPWKTGPTWTVGMIMIQSWLEFHTSTFWLGILQSHYNDLYKQLILTVPMLGKKNSQHHFPNDLGCCGTFTLVANTPSTLTTSLSCASLVLEDLVVSVVELDFSDILISWIYRLTTGTSPPILYGSSCYFGISIICHLNLWSHSETAFDMEDV